MKFITIITVIVVLSSVEFAQTTTTERRDKVLAQISACLKRDEVASRECRHLNENVDTLVEIYRSGDKSVLPTLFKFTYLADFYDEALLADPNGFLAELRQLPEKEQRYVAQGVAGGMYRIHDRNKFEAIVNLLKRLVELNPNEPTTQLLLTIVQTNNVSYLVTYFPPKIFAGTTEDPLIYWYSREMYSLGSKPLWPAPPTAETVYRLTYIGAFTGPKGVTLKIAPDGSGKIDAVNGGHQSAAVTSEYSVSRDQVDQFLATVDEANFWQMPTESHKRGFDGAEWILESVRKGEYHVVVRWCPGLYTKLSDDKKFAVASRMLLDFGGFNQGGGC